ncbi:hypothetical protein [Tabrizicola sp.]|uniref:hypothetical protein n=1 Tax=Tabrizicola sp. TaxID=2005166 RepID=UPI002735C2B1|nr:hypothetical protein [Tabrizicola sp.]MDP3195612.1 hypothetical protein [Tabrizicola sp.]
MFSAVRFLPRIVPMSPADFAALPWNGATDHIGPVGQVTPLFEALLKKTNCALYMIYLGCVGLCHQRTASVFDQKLNLLLMEQIFAYQFDGRYPKTFGITIDDVDDTSDKVRSVRRSIAFFFFELLERAPGGFLSERPIMDIAHMIHLTRHLCGTQNAAAVDGWLRGIIERLNTVAPLTVEHSPFLYDYPDRESWAAATVETHGTPLPLEVLDLALDLSGLDLVARATEELAEIDPAQNQLLVPPATLLAEGFVGRPYGRDR